MLLKTDLTGCFIECISDDGDGLMTPVLAVSSFMPQRIDLLKG
jgi:hypothetical protein